MTGRAKEARTASRADGQTGQSGPLECRWPDGRKRCGWSVERKRHGRPVEQKKHGRPVQLKRRGWSVEQKKERTAGLAEEAQMAGRADKQIGQLGPPEHGQLVGRAGGRVDKEVGLGSKDMHSSTPFHSLAPSLLASSERVCRVFGSAMGSRRIPTLKHLYYSKRARTHLPHLSAKCAGCSKGYLTFKI